MPRAVFLDRDGVLNEDRGYVHEIHDFVLYPGTGAALRRLQEAAFLLVLVTNQSGIGRGYYTLDAMHAIHRHLEALLARDGVRLARIYFAPEAPGQPSRHRKPSPQALFDARDTLGIDLSRSYLVGDKQADLECGWNAGVRRCLLVRTGCGAQVEHDNAPRLARAVVVDHLPAAVDWILTRDANPDTCP
ncbi:MAG TPA: HAD family hydrolase [Verrucomicrobiota bacterium]|nr:HAD family hydrolase [Verrucomicrobiota bacterium]HNU49522.1 HAD family hydrolase [Verrucomicrobiota bacterium]